MFGWTGHLTIRMKVNLIFGLLLFVLIGVGGLTFDRLTAISAEAENIGSDVLPATQILGKIADQTEHFRLLEAESVFAVAPAEIARIDREMTNSNETVNGLVTRLDPLIAAEQRAALRDFSSLWADFVKTGRAILNFSKDNDDVYARKTYQNDATKQFDRLQKGKEQLLEANVSDGDKAATASVAVTQGTEIALGSAISFAVAVCVGAILFLTRAVIRPMLGTAGGMDRLAHDDFTIHVSGTHRQDEIGILARSLAVLKQNAIAARNLEEQQRSEQRRKEERQNRIEASIRKFDQSFQQALSVMTEAASDMHQTAENLTKTADDASDRASAVAMAADATSANVQSVATATEEMAETIHEIARQVAQSSDIAGQAVDEAARTNKTIQGLAEAAQRIGDVVQLINHIASQTNLLALNATIEAARAGDAGRGFAVVASEVKLLANQTAEATDNIAVQIASIQSVTKEAVKAIQGIDTTIGRINQIAASVASAIEQQGAATREITRSTQEAARGTEEVSTSVGGVHAAANNTGAGAAHVLDASGQLARQTAALRQDMEMFLGDLRAA